MRYITAFFIVIIILTSQCYAQKSESERVSEAVPESVKELVGDIDDVSDMQGFFDRIFCAVKNVLADNFGKVIRNAVKVFLVAALCSVIGIFGDEKIPDYVKLCGCAAISFICVSDVNSYIKLGTDTINEISVFSKALLPALCTATAACGAVGSAAVKYAASAFFMDLFIDLAQNIILPLIYAFLAVSIASSAFENECLSGVSKLLKRITNGLMIALSLVFTGYISVSSAIASSGDAVVTKTAKTVISSAIPVVGGIISDAASSVVAGAELIKNTIGAFGMLTVLAVCISPIIIIALNFLAFKAAAVCISAMKNTSLASLADGIGSAFGMLVGLVGLCGTLMFISVLSCIRMVVG